MSTHATATKLSIAAKTVHCPQRRNCVYAAETKLWLARQTRRRRSRAQRTNGTPAHVRVATQGTQGGSSSRGCTSMAKASSHTPACNNQSKNLLCSSVVPVPSPAGCHRGQAGSLGCHQNAKHQWLPLVSLQVSNQKDPSSCPALFGA